MADKKTIGLSILLLGVLVVAYFGYRAYSSGSKGEALISGDGAPKESATQAGQEILALLSDLKKIHLDDSIFSNPSFLSLKDFTVEVKDQPKGRPNPFAPIGKDDFSGFTLDTSTSGTSSSNTAGSQTSVNPVTNPNEPNPTVTPAVNTAPAANPSQTTGASDNSFGAGTTPAGNTGPTVPPPSPSVPTM